MYFLLGLEQGIYLELSRCDSRNPNCAGIKNAFFAGSACLWVHSEKPLVLVLEDLHFHLRGRVSFNRKFSGELFRLA
jgi:hypothetical protein